MRYATRSKKDEGNQRAGKARQRRGKGGKERGGCVKEEKGYGRHARENGRWGRNKGGGGGSGGPIGRERDKETLANLTWVGKGLARRRELLVSLAWDVSPPFNRNRFCRRASALELEAKLLERERGRAQRAWPQKSHGAHGPKAARAARTSKPMYGSTRPCSPENSLSLFSIAQGAHVKAL